MEPSEPRVRRRGFLVNQDTGEPETGEYESPEGITFRIRIVKPAPKRRVVVNSQSQHTPLPRLRSSTEIHADRRASGLPGSVKSATATGTRPPERTRR
jgi:hypothetical protein